MYTYHQANLKEQKYFYFKLERIRIMKKFKKILAVSLAVVIAISMISFNTFAASSSEQDDETIYFTQTDAEGNVIQTIPLKKTEAGWNAYRKSISELSLLSTARATWNLSSRTYTLTKTGSFALYRLPYQFTGSGGDRVYVNANMTIPNGTWAEIAINNVTNGTSYLGSIELDKSGNIFSISGYLNNILSNNYYTYTLQASTNCSYAEVELYAE